jgi:signal transduction histidine kinase
MTEYFKNLNKPVIIVIGLILTTLVGLIDSQTGEEISFSVFYLIPISFVSWFADKKSGFVFSILCAVIWFYIDSTIKTEYSNPAIPYWNSMVRLGFFLVVLFLISNMKSLNEKLETKIKERTLNLSNEVSEHLKAKAEITRQKEELRMLTNRIQRIKEEENIKIAREIHDELGQSLTAINLELMWISKKYSNNADIVNRMVMLSGIVNDTIKTTRKISSSLRPRLLDQLGILAAIRSYFTEFSKRSGINCEAELPEGEINLDPILSTSLFRIFQEAVTNIARHSMASKVFVQIEIHSGILTMTIQDNGIGMNTVNGNKNGYSLGILGMKERAILLGGNLNILSQNGSGTEVKLEIPIKINIEEPA